MADIVRKIPDELSSLGITVNANYQLQDIAYDYAIAGLPFLSGTSDQRPYIESMAEIRKTQFDNSQEPGEQSLHPNGWWLRSQSTFNGGAGILYQDPDNDNQFNFRFDDSLGIDPWTSGDMKLLRDTAPGTTTAKTRLLVRGYVDGSGVDAYWLVRDDELLKITESGSTGIVGITLDHIWDITSSGKTYFFARTNGVYYGVDTAAPTQLYTDALDSTAVIEWVKGRLILGHDNKVYQLVTGGAAAALPAAIYTHQDTAWTWKSITDGPTAIYMAGDSGTVSEIHKFSPTLNSTTGVPELTWTGVTATMPAGEIINTIYQYVGSFVGIATNKGFRVGEIDSNGDISYGPLLFTPSGGCNGIVGFDRYMWTGSTNAHDGASGLYRVDLGSVIQEQTTRAVRYAYARDIYASASNLPITSLTMFGASDRKVFSVAGYAPVREMATQLVASGYLKTGRVRYNTEEPKLYKFFSIRCPAPLQGNVSVSVLSETGGDVPHITYTPANGAGVGDVAIVNPSERMNWIKLKFELFRGTDTSKGGEINGWQIKALPGATRQRVITQIFQLFNEEQDRTGQRTGYDTYARDRFEAFKQVARAGDVVTYQELQENLSTLVIIDDWEFRQLAAPGPNAEALGGYLTVQMRTVAESV